MLSLLFSLSLNPLFHFSLFFYIELFVLTAKPPVLHEEMEELHSPLSGLASLLHNKNKACTEHTASQ